MNFQIEITEAFVDKNGNLRVLWYFVWVLMNLNQNPYAFDQKMLRRNHPILTCLEHRNSEPMYEVCQKIS